MCTEKEKKREKGGGGVMVCVLVSQERASGATVRRWKAERYDLCFTYSSAYASREPK